MRLTGVGNWVIAPITKAERENDIPRFKDHNEAKVYFKKCYGRRFLFVDTLAIGDIKGWHYHLILDKEAYKQGLTSVRKRGRVIKPGFLSSYQPVEIFENGRLHISTQ